VIAGRARPDPIYSITWSARVSSDGGIVNPSALAVWRLITSSNLVGGWTGTSPGFAPLRLVRAAGELPSRYPMRTILPFCDCPWR
jgi:hypothetical protein